jgi:hypothetical protein
LLLLPLPPPLKKNQPEPVLVVEVVVEVVLPEEAVLLEKKLCSANRPARIAIANLMNARPNMVLVSSNTTEIVKWARVYRIIR